MKRMRSRTVARMLAEARGFFWLPCPVCGEYFAGFEWDTSGECSSIPREDNCGVGICPEPACMERAREWTMRYRLLRMCNVDVDVAVAAMKKDEATIEREWYAWTFKHYSPFARPVDEPPAGP
jgi:hypothetical protein